MTRTTLHGREAYVVRGGTVPPSELRHYLEVIRQLHSPTTLTPRKQPLLPIQ